MLLSVSKFVENFQLTFSTKDNREKLNPDLPALSQSYQKNNEVKLGNHHWNSILNSLYYYSEYFMLLLYNNCFNDTKLVLSFLITSIRCCMF